MTAIWTAALAAAALPSLAQRVPEPVFLDSSSEIRVWVDPPIAPDEMKGRFAVTVNRQARRVASVAPGDAPQLARVLPRTPGRVVLAGTIQSALGAKEWDPDGESTQMTEVRPGVHELVVRMPQGTFQYKAARDGSWNENYGAGFVSGGPNISLTVPAGGAVVKFVVDLNQRIILDSINNPEQVSAPAAAPARPKPSGPPKHHVAVVRLQDPIRPDEVDEDIVLADSGGRQRRVVSREVLSDRAFQYRGPLGAVYSPLATTFKVWAPVSRMANLRLFDGPTGDAARTIPMTRSRNGVWTAKVAGDLHGAFYEYEFLSYGVLRRATDIFSRAASKDSRRSMVVDMARTNPPSWPSQPKLRHRSQTDAVLYELHVRDFTVHADSGVDVQNRGKYAGMVQRGARVPGTGFKTGLDYLVDLGVTDIHLLPVHNFLTGSPDEYTWGYATNLFNVPEETYSVRPGDPVAVIREFKQMVQGMHQAGLRVILDVVYNHSWPPEGAESNFWQTVPYYYFRTNDRGDVLNESGVGNALADERPMVRQFIQESLMYWLKEYRVDGYRFDLIGMHHPQSVRQWSREMRRLRPDIILYGEPWTGGGPTHFGKGAQRGSGVAVFNDRFRGAFRGELDGPGPGFAMGGSVDRTWLMQAISGWIDWPGRWEGFANSPQETINYVSAHDNLTLWDRAALSIPADRPDLRLASVRLAGAAVLLSQGVPFLEGGAQIGRTKGGNGNSYNAGDLVNGYDWDRGLEYTGLNEWYKGLIAIRREHPVFRLATAAQVRQRLSFPEGFGEGLFAFRLDGAKAAPFGEYLVVLNGSREPRTASLGKGEWQVLADGTRASDKPFAQAKGRIEIAPLSAWVLAKGPGRSEHSRP